MNGASQAKLNCSTNARQQKIMKNLYCGNFSQPQTINYKPQTSKDISLGFSSQIEYIF